MSKKIFIILFSGFFIFSINSFAAQEVDKIIDNQIIGLYQTYQELHRNPELSLLEKNTSKKLADEMRKIGFDVTENFGGYGVVSILKNGKGPTVLIRTDMDALPVKELTNLSFASNVIMNDNAGERMPAMHACGHDMHMTVWLGVAKTLSELKNNWSGTLVMIAEPAEEIGRGSRLMLDKGLYKLFPIPNYALALHTMPSLASGKVAYKSGYIMANADRINMEIYGVGGHGAIPGQTIDPVVLSAKIILDLQTIISRQINPIDPAVITVGAINGGTKNSIIPDQVDLKLSIRTYKDEVREKILTAIKNITEGNAIAAGLPRNKFPKIIVEKIYTKSLYNSDVLEERLKASFTTSVGENNLMEQERQMVADDFSMYGKTKENVPIALFNLGVGDPNKIKKNVKIPSLHSASFKIYEPKLVIKTGIKTMSLAVIDLMKNNK